MVALTTETSSNTPTTTSSQLVSGADFFPPNNGPITFDKVVSTFTVDTLSPSATVDRAMLEYTLFSPAVPEPTTYAMMLLGLAALGTMTRRRKVAAL